MMANYQETGGYCKYCEERVPIRRPAPNHILHLILTVCTLGFWAIVWLGVSVQFGGWRCSRCGSKAGAGVPKGQKRQAAA